MSSENGKGEVAKTSKGGYGYELKKLRSRHHQIIRLKASGKFKNKEIAEIVNVTPQTVSNTLNSELAQRKMAQLQDDIDDQFMDLMAELRKLAEVGVEEIRDALLNETVSKEERLDLAQDLLDRTGYGKTSNLNINKRQVTDKDIEEIREEAKKEAEESGKLEEANIIVDEEEDSSPDE